MSPTTRIPLAFLSALSHSPELLRLYVYMLERADAEGEYRVSPKSIEIDLGISRQRLRTMIKTLTATSAATAQSTGCSTTLKFYLSERKSRAATTQSTTLSTAQKSTVFTPPTDEEVAAYVTEKGYHFNPEQFVPYYQKQGWKQNNGTPIKDWKAACRYWETTWKERHGTRFYYEIQPAAARYSDRGAADRYSALENAADTILRGAPDIHTPQND